MTKTVRANMNFSVLIMIMNTIVWWSYWWKIKNRKIYLLIKMIIDKKITEQLKLSNSHSDYQDKIYDYGYFCTISIQALYNGLVHEKVLDQSFDYELLSSGSLINLACISIPLATLEAQQLLPIGILSVKHKTQV